MSQKMYGSLTHSFWRVGKERANSHTSSHCSGTAGTGLSCPLRPSTVQENRVLLWHANILSAEPCQPTTTKNRFQVITQVNLKQCLSRTTASPYGLWTANNGLHHVFSDLSTVVFMDVEGKHHFPQRGLSVLPVLTHHVLQVDGS